MSDLEGLLRDRLAELTEPALLPPAGLVTTLRRRHARRRLLAPAAGLAAALALTPVLLATGGESGASTLRPGASSAPGVMTTAMRESLVYDCELWMLPDGQSGGGGIASITGDVVKDCQAEYERVSGHVAPPMTAYSTGDGEGLAVLPTTATPPTGYGALPAGTLQDVEKILVNESLSDAVSGLGTACNTEAQALASARRIVEQDHFSAWSVVVDRRPVASDATCWVAFARGSDRTVRVVKGGFNIAADAHANAQLEAFAEPLRESKTACWDRAMALGKIPLAAASARIQPGYVQVITADDPKAACSTIHVSLWHVVVRGPAN